jgi:predicted DNA-binding transcriptional regulator AlpA
MAALLQPIPSEATMAKFLSIQDVAARYGTSRHTVYRWMRERKGFPTADLTLPSGSPRWSVGILEAWEAEHRPAAAA